MNTNLNQETYKYHQFHKQISKFPNLAVWINQTDTYFLGNSWNNHKNPIFDFNTLHKSQENKKKGITLPHSAIKEDVCM